MRMTSCFMLPVLSALLGLSGCTTGPASNSSTYKSVKNDIWYKCTLQRYQGAMREFCTATPLLQMKSLKVGVYNQKTGKLCVTPPMYCRQYGPRRVASPAPTSHRHASADAFLNGLVGGLGAGMAVTGGGNFGSYPVRPVYSPNSGGRGNRCPGATIIVDPVTCKPLH